MERRKRRQRKTENGILAARPCARVSALTSGLHRLGVSSDRDAVVFVPESCRPSVPAPLVVTLHGAGANAHDAMQPLRRIADRRGIVLLAPNARQPAWDLLDGGFGPDVDFIDHALASTFEKISIDSRRIAIEGFSDGGTYALSLGLTNAELFTHVIAFSPGFLKVPAGNGKPRIFISHGSHDLILPTVRCSHRIVTRLERDGYDVTFREFPGAHEIPAHIARAAVDWFLSAAD